MGRVSSVGLYFYAIRGKRAVQRKKIPKIPQRSRPHCRSEANPQSQPSGPRRPVRLSALDDVTTPRAVRWGDATDASPLVLQFADDHHAFHEDAKPGDLAGQLGTCSSNSSNQFVTRMNLSSPEPPRPLAKRAIRNR